MKKHLRKRLNHIFKGIFSSNIFAQELVYLKGNTNGYVREKIVLNNEEVYAISTDRDLYLIKDKSIVQAFNLNQTVIFLEVVSDVNNNGYDEKLIFTNSNNLDNIYLYDSKEYELVFKTAITMSAYNLYHDKDLPSGYYDIIVPVESYRVKDILLYGVAGYKAFILDLQSSNFIWEELFLDNLWDIELIGDIDKDKHQDVMVIQQRGNLLALSGQTGKVIYESKIPDPVKSDIGMVLSLVYRVVEKQH